jgi:hypothetical protein
VPLSAPESGTVYSSFKTKRPSIVSRKHDRDEKRRNKSSSHLSKSAATEREREKLIKLTDLMALFLKERKFLFTVRLKNGFRFNQKQNKITNINIYAFDSSFSNHCVRMENNVDNIPRYSVPNERRQACSSSLYD